MCKIFLGVCALGALSLGSPTAAPLPNPLPLDEIAVGSVPGARFEGPSDVSGNGLSLSGAGDVNADGLEDMLVGAWLAKVEAERAAGTVYAVFGRLDSWPSGDPLLLPGLDGAQGFQLRGSVAYGAAGFALSGAGDLNSDGFPDILLGAPGLSGAVPHPFAAGAYYLVFGGNTPPGENGVLRLSDPASPEGIAYAGQLMDHLGFGVSGLGDFDGDGFDDMAFGLGRLNTTYDPYQILVPNAEPGETRVQFGLPSSGEFRSARLVSIHSSTEIEADHWVSGIGDFNGDGFDDLAIATYGGVDRLAPEALGETYVLFGSLTGFGASLEKDLSSLASGEGFRMPGFTPPASSHYRYERYLFAGRNVSGVGDLNGDGLAELLISEYYGDLDTTPGHTQRIACYLVYGTEQPIGENGVFNLPSLDGANGFIFAGTMVKDGYAIASGVGDINGDGFFDLGFSSAGSDDGQYHAFITGEGLIYGSQSILAPGGVFDVSTLDGTKGVSLEVSPEHLRTTAIAGAGDVNGDGIGDFLLYALGNYLPPPYEPDMGYVVFGSSSSPSATYRTHTRAGDAPRRGVGMIGDGSHSIPFSRCWVDFDGGSGPGLRGSSLETVTVTRSSASIEAPIGHDRIADVLWQASTNRTGWSQARLTFHYLDREIEGLDEVRLRLYYSDSLSGPWFAARPMALNTRRNEIAGTVPARGAMGYFAIAETGGSLGIDNEAIIRHLLGLPSSPEAVLDVNADRQVDASDLVFNVEALSR
jgi:hypothetical protein